MYLGDRGWSNIRFRNEPGQILCQRSPGRHLDGVLDILARAGVRNVISFRGFPFCKEKSKNKNQWKLKYRSDA